MSGDKYVTLSKSLAVYATLMGYVSKLLNGPEARSSTPLKNGLTACYQKLEKFFDKSTFNTEYYYFAMSEYRFSCYTEVLLTRFGKSLTHGIRIQFSRRIRIFSLTNGSGTVMTHLSRS